MPVITLRLGDWGEHGRGYGPVEFRSLARDGQNQWSGIIVYDGTKIQKRVSLLEGDLGGVVNQLLDFHDQFGDNGDVTLEIEDEDVAVCVVTGWKECNEDELALLGRAIEWSAQEAERREAAREAQRAADLVRARTALEKAGYQVIAPEC